MKPNKKRECDMKCKVRALMLMLLMCWASQSSAQPTRAQNEINSGLSPIIVVMDSLEPQQQVIVVAQASKTQQAKPKKEYVMGICQGAYRRTSEKYGSYNSMGVTYLLGGMDRAMQYWGLRDIPEFIKPEHIQVLHSPKHGKLVYEAFPQNSNPGSDYGDYLYTPDIGYVGNDKMTFKLDVNGKIFKIVYVFKVVHERNVTNDDPSAYCPEPETWKISSTSP
jgi:hypothetical protein